MKKLLMTSSAAALLGPTVAMADPTFMIGAGVTFGGGQSPQYALTAKVLSDNQNEEFVAGAGVSYYFGTGDFGADVGVGYLMDDTALMFGYDFLQGQAQVSLGYAEVEEVVETTVAPSTTVVLTTTPTTAPPTTMPTTAPPA